MKKIMKLSSLLMLTLFAFTNCAKEEPVVDEQVNVTTTPGLKSPGDGRYDALGCGYDITGEFFSPFEVKSHVINVDLISKTNINMIDSNLVEGRKSYDIYGIDASDYTTRSISKINAKASIGFLFGFTGNLKKDSKSENTFSSKVSYWSNDVTIRKKSYNFHADANDLLPYLTRQFKSAIETKSADYIVKMYGTHVLMDVKLGGKLSVLYRSEIINTSSYEEKKQALSAGFNKILTTSFTINAGGESHKMDSLVYKNTKTRFFYETSGGNASLSLKGEFDPQEENLKINTSAWEGSIDKKSGLYGLIHSDELIPIYEFVTDPVKKAQIKTAVEKYIKSKKPVLTNELELMPLYRLYNGRDHFYVNNWPEALGAIRDVGYRFEESEMYILKNQENGAVPLYRYYSNKKRDHFYTATWSGQLVAGQYHFERIEGYVYKTKEENTVPIYSYDSGKDHFYTPFKGNVSGYKFENYVNFYAYHYKDINASSGPGPRVVIITIPAKK